jgi:hypothetical protein
MRIYRSKKKRITILWDINVVDHYQHHSSVLRTEAAHSSETFVMVYQITWYKIPESSNLHSHWHENLKLTKQKEGLLLKEFVANRG